MAREEDTDNERHDRRDVGNACSSDGAKLFNDVVVNDVSQTRPAQFQPTTRPIHARVSLKEDRKEAEHDAQEYDLTRRYVFGSPFYKDEIASPDHSEQSKSKVSGFLHGVIRLLCVSP